jgi:hypothetical protein
LPSAFPLPVAPPAPFVNDDLPCRTCSYNLKTLPTDGVCPECATPVAVSLKSDLLRGSDPRWMKLLRLGGLFIIYGALALWFASQNSTRIGSAWWLIMWAGRFVELTGVWMMTLTDPSGIGEQRLRNLRNATRIFFSARAAVGVFWAAIGSILVGPNFGIRIAVYDFEQLIEVLGVMTLFFYLGRLVMRIPNPALARSFCWGAWAFAVLSAIGVLQLPALLMRQLLWRPGIFWVFNLLSIPRLLAIFLLFALINQCRIAIGREADVG